LKIIGQIEFKPTFLIRSLMYLTMIFKCLELTSTFRVTLC
jgi:hypothetical protein